MGHWDSVFERTQQDTWWMPTRVVLVDRPDVTYTYDPERDPRYSIVTRVHPSLEDYGEVLEEVLHHQAPSGDCSFMVASPSYSPALENELKRQGFIVRGQAHCWSIDVLNERPPLPDHVRVNRVETEEDLRDADAVAIQCFEHYHGIPEESLTRDLAACVGPDARCRRYIARDATSGRALSVGAFNVYPKENVGFMWGGATIPEARGQGTYSALVTARMEEAKTLGLDRMGLYAITTTSGPIVEKQGFEKHGLVTFWFRATEDGHQESKS